MVSAICRSWTNVGKAAWSGWSWRMTSLIIPSVHCQSMYVLPALLPSPMTDDLCYSFQSMVWESQDTLPLHSGIACFTSIAPFLHPSKLSLSKWVEVWVRITSCIAFIIFIFLTIKRSLSSRWNLSKTGRYTFTLYSSLVDWHSLDPVDLITTESSNRFGSLVWHFSSRLVTDTSESSATCCA